MLHFAMGGVLILGAHPLLIDQVKRVALFCGSPDIRHVADTRTARAAAERMAGLQLVVIDLRLGRTDIEDFQHSLRSSRTEHVRWAVTAGLLATEDARDRPLFESLGLDGLLVGPHSDTFLEKQLRAIVLDGGANPRNPTQLEALFHLIETGDFERVEPIIRRGLKRFPDSLEYVVFLCELHFRLGRHREALILAMATLDRHPGYTALRHLAARCYVKDGNISQAFIVLEQGRRDPAGEDFALRFDTFESVVKCLNNEGVRRAKDGDLDQALGLYLHALDSTANFPEHHRYVLWHNLGMTYRRKGNITEARKAFARAMRLAPPAFVEARTALARAEWEHEERLREARVPQPPHQPRPHRVPADGAGAQVVAQDADGSGARKGAQSQDRGQEPGHPPREAPSGASTPGPSPEGVEPSLGGLRSLGSALKKLIPGNRPQDSSNSSLPTTSGPPDPSQQHPSNTLDELGALSTSPGTQDAPAQALGQGDGTQSPGAQDPAPAGALAILENFDSVPSGEESNGSAGQGTPPQPSASGALDLLAASDLDEPLEVPLGPSQVADTLRPPDKKGPSAEPLRAPGKAAPGAVALGTAKSASQMDELARREKRRQDKLKFIMFEKEQLEEG